MIMPMPFGGIDLVKSKMGRKCMNVSFCSPVCAEEDQYLYFGGFLFE